MTEEQIQRARAALLFTRIRWGVALLLLFLYVFQKQSLAFMDPAWRPVLYGIGAYLAMNILFRASLRSRIEQSSAATIMAISVLGIVSDLTMTSFYMSAISGELQLLSFIWYILPIVEAAILFDASTMILVFLCSSALYGSIAIGRIEGEVYLERIIKLAPQGSFLIFLTSIAWALRQSISGHAAELSHSKRLTETIVENLTDGILILDGEMRMMFVNKGGESILGIKESEVLGLKIRKNIAYPIKNAANLLKIVGADIPDGNAKDIQLEHPEEKILKVNRIPLVDNQNVPIGHMLVFRDVSRDAFLNKLKSDFISVAAHQLRTPLSSIKWAFDMLKEGGSGPLTEDQKPIVDQGFETSDRLVRLVNSLLNASRIEEGRFGFAFEEVDAKELVGRVMATLKPKAESRNVTINPEIEEALAPMAADPEKIELVLENLVDNAVSYSQPGGTVRIEAKSEGKFLRFSIIDNGVGIPQSQQQLLYTKFFRGDNVVRMQTDGSGLGMYIAKNIVEKHGGSMNVSSRENEGTTVSFTVPFAG